MSSQESVNIPDTKPKKPQTQVASLETLVNALGIEQAVRVLLNNLVEICEEKEFNLPRLVSMIKTLIKQPKWSGLLVQKQLLSLVDCYNGTKIFKTSYNSEESLR